MKIPAFWRKFIIKTLTNFQEKSWTQLCRNFQLTLWLYRWTQIGINSWWFWSNSGETLNYIITGCIINRILWRFMHMSWLKFSEEIPKWILGNTLARFVDLLVRGTRFFFMFYLTFYIVYVASPSSITFSLCHDTFIFGDLVSGVFCFENSDFLGTPL